MLTVIGDSSAAVSAGYRAMDERRAVKVLLRPADRYGSGSRGCRREYVLRLGRVRSDCATVRRPAAR